MPDEPALSIPHALTQLARLLLEQDDTQAHTLVCAQGCFYRATVSLESVPPEEVANAIQDYL
ncbi:hypothetical protein SAMN02745148_01065 [Modicisalibacter ilicicola DSM 19980]|uniref:Uncharacterized protein n=1 Tax=Modicisalibacter ilicicola DSM 19980 TaxID=1121942 RepID=A0A1M4W447_9GAMM|nr:hypothetical protein [Halomonas ilicicola]SHE75883.1 hypothetical protein SAMN02745148_01065 [Halomonas ilicicola DSM 19980]